MHAEQRDKADMSTKLQRFIAFISLLFFLTAFHAEAQQHISLPHTGFTPKDIALIVNDADPLSRQVGHYYQKVRKIPDENVIHLRFPPGRRILPAKEFSQLKTIIDERTRSHIQAYAVAWTEPYRVGCMSLTSALAFGFDKKFCSKQCAPTAPNPYFNSPSHNPANDHQIRPAMMLAGLSFEHVKKLIDRGVASDHSFPDGTAYLLSTSDRARNSRSNGFKMAAEEFLGVFAVQLLDSDVISNRRDVLFYFTGLSEVNMLQSLNFLPGALADHLTSAGGMLTNSRQMSSLRWLEAGATASYGTVVEPCSYPQKFPSAVIAMFYYATGATAIEAYWKSVAWPGQGVFIGEPLAKPFAPMLRKVDTDQFELKIFSPRTSILKIEESTSAAGPFKPIAHEHPIHRGENVFQFSFNEKKEGYLRLQWH